MNSSYGMGLVLTLRDNMTPSLNRVNQSFINLEQNIESISNAGTDNLDSLINSMSLAGMGLSIVGDQFMRTGSAITGFYANMIKTTTDVGTSVLGSKITLEALFQSAEQGQKAFDWVKTYAATSIFNFEDLLSSMISMKAVGVDIRKEVETTSGQTQNLLNYAGDLAAMFPNMRNAYGTGIKAAMGAMKEYIAEGNALTLKRGAGLDITQILGEDKGATIEDRTRQIADLIEKINAFGMTENLKGTPMQMMSNFKDVWFMFLTEISDKGVYDKFTEQITRISQFLMGLIEDSEGFTALTDVISNVFTILMKPVDLLITGVIKLVNLFKELSETSPAIATLIGVLGAVAGSILVATGFAMKFAGSLLMVVASFLLIKRELLANISLTSIWGTTVNFVMTKFLPFLALALLIYKVWKNNIFGIRDIVKNVFGQISTIASLVADAFVDNELDYDSYIKAKELGVMPLIEAILLLKHIVKNFATGFAEGVKSFSVTTQKIADFFGNIKINLYELSGVLGKVIKFFIGDKVDGDKWEQVGSAVGRLVSIFVALKIALLPIKALLKIGGAVSKGWQTLQTILNSKMFLTITKGASSFFKLFSSGIGILTKTIIPRLLGGIKTIGTVIMSVATTIAGALGISVGAVFAIAIAIGAVVAIIIKNWDKIKEWGIKTWEGLKEGWNKTKETVLGAWENFVQGIRNKIEAIKTVFTNMKESFLQNWEELKTQVSNIFNNIGNIIKSAISGAYNFVVGIINGIKSAFNTIVTKVVNVFNRIKNSTSEGMSFVKGIIKGAIDAISNIIMSIIQTVLAVVEAFKGNWNSAVSYVKGAFNSLKNAALGVCSAIYNAFAGIGKGIISVFSSIAEKVKGIFSSLANSKIGKLVSSAVGGFTNLIGLSTGGYVKEEGIAVLHPNEVVVNDKLTQGLSSFLEEQNNPKKPQLPTVNEPKIPLPESRSNNSGNYTEDNKLVFNKGSVVIQVANTTEKELDKVAERLITLIDRKRQVKNMANRRNKAKKGEMMYEY